MYIVINFDVKVDMKFFGRGGTIFCGVCGKGHTHTDLVTLTEGNPAKQPRSFHRLKCPETRRGDKRSDYWKVMTIAEAESCRRHGRHAPAPSGCCLRMA